MAYYLVALGAWLFPLALRWNAVGGGDYDIMAAWAQVALWWHQGGNYNVSWNPFFCGGAPLLSNSQLPIYHLSVPLYFLFGPVAGLKVLILLWMTAGFFLFSRLMEDYGFSKKVACFFGAAWAMNGFFVGHMGQMHSYYTCFFLVPGFYLLARKWISTARVRYLAGFLALTVVAGMHSYAFFAYFYFSIPVFFLLELIVRRLPLRSALYLTLPFFTTIAASFGCLAVFILPAADHLRKVPRITELMYEPLLKDLAYLLVPGRLFDQGFRTWEYQLFIGPVLFGFFILGLWRLRKTPRAFVPLFVCAAIHAALAMGSFKTMGWAIPSPFDLAYQFVPGFSSVRINSRFLIGSVPGILLLSAFTWNPKTITRKMAFLTLSPLVVFCAYNFLHYSPHSQVLQEPKPFSVSKAFEWTQPNGNPYYYQRISSTKGTIDCYDPTPYITGPVSPGPLVRDPAPGISWSRPAWDRLEFKVENASTEIKELEVNMNHHQYWQIANRAGLETKLTSQPGQLIRLQSPPGNSEFTLAFRDPNQSFGRLVALISFVSFALFLILLSRVPFYGEATFEL
jgi:hypothetical protein